MTSKYWDDYYEQGRDFISVNPQELKQLLAYASKTAPKTALDIGCGTGQLTRDLHHSGYKVVGIDISEKALTIARSLTNISPSELRYAHHDAENGGLKELPFAPYGLITCQSVYAFIKNKEKLLATVQEALAPSGIFVIISMLDKNVPAHKKEAALNPADTQATLQKYFQVNYYEKSGLGNFVCAKKT